MFALSVDSLSPCWFGGSGSAGVRPERRASGDTARRARTGPGPFPFPLAAHKRSTHCRNRRWASAPPGSARSAVAPELQSLRGRISVLLCAGLQLPGQSLRLRPRGRCIESEEFFGEIPFTHSATDEQVRGVIQRAHAYGWDVLLKPHIDPLSGGWRGHIEPSDTAEWFVEYNEFIEHWAELAAEDVAPGQTLLDAGDIFSVGCEFKTMSSNTGDWADIITAVGGILPGDVQITYAANCDECPAVAFWGHSGLDLIGIDAYFGLDLVGPAGLRPGYNRPTRPQRLRAAPSRGHRPLHEHGSRGPQRGAVRPRALSLANADAGDEGTVAAAFLYNNDALDGDHYTEIDFEILSRLNDRPEGELVMASWQGCRDTVGGVVRKRTDQANLDGASQYHVYQLDWSSDSVIFTVFANDGQAVAQRRFYDDVSWDSAYVMMNLWSGGWAGHLLPDGEGHVGPARTPRNERRRIC